jgi:hypothetical protein
MTVPVVPDVPFVPTVGTERSGGTVGTIGTPQKAEVTISAKKINYRRLALLQYQK